MGTLARWMAVTDASRRHGASWCATHRGGAAGAHVRAAGSTSMGVEPFFVGRDARLPAGEERTTTRMGNTSFDPAAFKAQQREQWSNVAQGWRRRWEAFERGGQPLSD